MVKWFSYNLSSKFLFSRWTKCNVINNFKCASKVTAIFHLINRSIDCVTCIVRWIQWVRIQNSTVFCLLITYMYVFTFGVWAYGKYEGKRSTGAEFATFCTTTTSGCLLHLLPLSNGLSPGSSEQRTIGECQARISYSANNYFPPMASA